MEAKKNIRKISFVAPCYNEEEVLGEFYRRSIEVAQKFAKYTFEFIFVNDCSSDKTPIILNVLASKDERVKVIHLAKNQGHQVALSAGLDFATGDMIVTLDVDLQDPPELLGDFLEKIEAGYEVVHAQRKKREGETKFKLYTAWIFYKIIKKLSDSHVVENSGDFRAFTKNVLTVIKSFREKHRFLRGLFAYVGFKQCIVMYDRDARYAGETKYPFKKMFKLAVNALLGFSTAPIRMIMWCSILMWATTILYVMKSLYFYFAYDRVVPGWTSIIMLLFFFTGLILFSVGIVGSYIGRIYEQGQNRPLYWIHSVHNVDEKNILAAATREMDLFYSENRKSEVV